MFLIWSLFCAIFSLLFFSFAITACQNGKKLDAFVFVFVSYLELAVGIFLIFRFVSPNI